jgi:hypothetical protein
MVVPGVNRGGSEVRTNGFDESRDDPGFEGGFVIEDGRAEPLDGIWPQPGTSPPR